MMEYFCVSDIGLKREKNQDSYCSLKNNNDDCLFLVCDGIGGGKAGEVASSETIRYFIDKFTNANEFNSLDDAISFLDTSIKNCNKEVNKLSNKYKEYQGMGTTLTGLLFTKHGVLSINVGDSRVYGFIDDKLFSLTDDHTLVNDMLKNGEITYEESLTHPKRHYLVKAIGVWDLVEPDIHKVQKLDYYLICSDGLHGYVKQNDINRLMNKDLTCEDKARKLLELALLQGGYDNITIIVIDNRG